MKYILLFFLLACSEPQAHPPTVLVIGNSITRHAPDASIGWSGDWGMAASDSLHDFAHQLGQLIAAINVANIETNPTTFQWSQVAALHMRPDLTVVELGDNVSDTSSVAPVYAALVDTATIHSRRVLCTSTWWNNATVNAMIRHHCPGVVDISAFSADPANLGAGFANHSVAIHPGDAGMALIARAIAGTQ